MKPPSKRSRKRAKELLKDGPAAAVSKTFSVIAEVFQRESVHPTHSEAFMNDGALRLGHMIIAFFLMDGRVVFIDPPKEEL